MTKPLIQIDDEIREMTDDEHAIYLETQATARPLPGTEEPAE
jgi:hypothetical protein